MRGAEHEIYCTVAEAGCVLGISPNEVRVKMNRGELNLGTVEKRNRYSVYRIRKDLMIKEAGLSEFPEDASASPKKRKAEYTALMLKKEGIDVQKVADIFLESKIITPYQWEIMMGMT